MMQKYYKIEFIPTAKGRFGSVHAIELWTEQQVTNYANKMVRNDLNSQKINFELRKVGVNMENYITNTLKIKFMLLILIMIIQHYNILDTKMVVVTGIMMMMVSGP